MRSNAQRSVDQQGLMPADRGSMGITVSLGTQGAIERAFKAWIARRGIDNTTNFGKRDFSKKGRNLTVAAPAPAEAPAKAKAPRPARPKISVPRDKPAMPKISAEEAKVRRAVQRKAYRERNLERIKAAGRIAAQQRRDSMTPEQRKAESEKIMAYKRAAREQKKSKQ